MNKLIFVLLVVCLVSVSVQAFVKRDAPAPAAGSGSNNLEDLMKQIQEWGKTAGEKIQENLNPEKIKDDFEKFSSQIKETLEKLQPTEKKA